MMEYVQRELPYARSFVLRSVYGVLRQEWPYRQPQPLRLLNRSRALTARNTHT